ncbi:glucokinase [Thalassotalea castellviae]|uniref:Glucokinase n=1 Tax=Thalassotalea castellviae TaxID=3075612 RepID=A0ABU2ZVX1_9GAMM|nr:glucokinase [Thalassotalea sp. W431]MDT0602079.1 glucokinase [Thalassotalea sp. W431]
MSQIINLVADIGGTNIRLGTFEHGAAVTALKVYQCGNYQSLSEVIRTYIDEENLAEKTINACLAIACPVENDLISMTNLPWTFSQKALKEELSLNKLLLINDYTAIAHAVPYLNKEQKVQIGGGEVVDGKPISICGPGTGLGVANVVPLAEGQWQALGGEGGHVDFAPIDQTEIKILEYLLNQYQHVSYEQLLSGLGLEQIYQALNHIEQAEQPILSAQDISEKALSNTCQLCEKTLAQFCKILGSFAGNLSLTLASFGGVYIAGGIVPRFIDYLKQSEFRSRFESKGRITFNQTIPTFVITESQPGILGASAYLRQHNLQNKG